MIGLVHTPKLISNIRAVHVHIAVLDDVETEELGKTLFILSYTPDLFLLRHPFYRLCKASVWPSG
jgi:hypothetical protein